MKVLLDTCISSKTKSALQVLGHDVVWSGEWEEDPGDEEILAIAYEEGRVLITLDKDFGELAIVQRKPHAGIIRLATMSASQQSQVCIRLLVNYEEELIEGAIITADLKKVRIRSGLRDTSDQSER